ncbi:MAG: hypothetical protein QXP98_07345 [Thermoproteus sp.]
MRSCVEREYIPIIRERFKCQPAGELDLGFIALRPDLICDGIPTEVECISTVYCGVGQALAYKYIAGAARLIVIADVVRGEVLRFLKWVSETTGVEVFLFVEDTLIHV